MTDISIVLPVYNGSKYLSLSIESILAQTYQNWELIIVNDCSTDSSLAIAEEYAQKDRRIRILSNSENQRLPRSLNIGFANAAGRYFTWTSDDNLFHSRALETMASYLDAHEQCGMVYCDMDYIDADGKVISNTQNTSHNFYLSNCIGACFMYRREAADTVGGYDPDKFLVEDYDYWLRISFQYPVERIPQILYSYRHHSGNMTSVYEKKIADNVFNLRVEYLDRISEHLSAREFSLYCTGLLLNKPDAGPKIEEIAFRRGLKYDAAKILSHSAFDADKKFIIFGAGVIGQQALRMIGRTRVSYFADNLKYGQTVDGIEVISAERVKDLQHLYNVMIAVDYSKSAEIIEQMERIGVLNYSLFLLIKDRLERLWNPAL